MSSNNIRENAGVNILINALPEALEGYPVLGTLVPSKQNHHLKSSHLQLVLASQVLEHNLNSRERERQRQIVLLIKEGQIER